MKISLGSDRRKYGIIIYSAGLRDPQVDKIVISAICKMGNFLKLCIVGTVTSIDKCPFHVVHWNFKKSVSNRNYFIDVKKEVGDAELGSIIRQETDFHGIGNIAVLGNFAEGDLQLPGFTSHRLRNLKDLNELELYNESNLILIHSDEQLVREVLNRIYFRLLKVDRIFIAEASISSWQENDKFPYYYHPTTSDGKSRLIHHWAPLIDQFNFVSTDIKEYHLITENEYQTLCQSSIPATLGITLLAIKMGCPLNGSSADSRKLDLYRLNLLGYLEDDYATINDGHILWRLADQLNLSQLLDTKWLQLASSLDFAVHRYRKPVVDQILLFISLICYYDYKHYKLSTLLYSIDDRYKASESDFLTILNYLNDGSDSSLMKSITGVKNQLHVNDWKFESSMSSEPITESLLQCFKHGFLLNLGYIKAVEFKDGSRLVRFRIADSDNNGSSIPALSFQISPELERYYSSGDFVLWYELYQPDSSDDYYPFMGLKVTRDEIVGKYYRMMT
ncbi:DEKNAAC100671 [Brettanomyces naardenensis]|uniref:DEKNAAC100671 n=1 Tax=Brettanomyces naardenensis TaxID=13370 RepID=A0A448YEW4_BRENA|nr:DEKNAAC100671 [Brettanomyces naardenensis]